MARRNVGSRRVDTRITALDPEAVALQVGNLTVANPQVVKPAGPNAALQQALDAMVAVGRLGQKMGEMREEKKAAGKADAAARRGDYTLAAQEDAAAIETMFKQDTLAEQETDTSVGPQQYTDLEDELIQRIEAGQESGIAPEVILGQWAREQIDITSGRLADMNPEAHAVALDVYSKHYFPKVLAAASDWYNGRVEDTHNDTVVGIASGLSTGDSTYRSPTDLQRDSKKDNFLLPMNKPESNAVWMDAAEMAAERGEYGRARELFDAISEEDRDVAWHTRSKAVRDAELHQYQIGVGNALRNESGLDVYLDEFSPKQEVAEVNGETKTIVTLPPLQEDRVSRFRAAAISYAQDQSIPLYKRSAMIERMYGQVYGTAKEAVSAARNALPTVSEEQARVDAARKRNKEAASNAHVDLLQDGEITYTNSKGEEITLKASDDDAKIKLWMNEVYGPDGSSYFDDFLALRSSGRIGGPDPQQSDAITSGHLTTIEDAVDGPNEEGVYQRAEVKRNDAVATAIDQFAEGKITLEQLRQIRKASDASTVYDRDRNPQEVSTTQNSIARAFGQSSGMEVTESFMDRMPVISTPTVDMHKDTAWALNEIQSAFRGQWLAWHRKNTHLLDSDPVTYQQKRSEWLSDRSEVFHDLASKVGHAVSARNQKQKNEDDRDPDLPDYVKFDKVIMRQWISGMPAVKEKDSDQ